MKSRDVARGLAWFGIGLGAVEVLAPQALARTVGLAGHARLLRVFGWREIAAGIVVLNAKDPEAWLWTRVAGDLLDGALLGTGMGPQNPDRQRTLLATLAVAPVVVLDVAYSRVARRRQATRP